MLWTDENCITSEWVQWWPNSNLPSKLTPPPDFFKVKVARTLWHPESSVCFRVQSCWTPWTSQDPLMPASPWHHLHPVSPLLLPQEFFLPVSLTLLTPRWTQLKFPEILAHQCLLCKHGGHQANFTSISDRITSALSYVQPGGNAHVLTAELRDQLRACGHTQGPSSACRRSPSPLSCHSWSVTMQSGCLSEHCIMWKTRVFTCSWKISIFAQHICECYFWYFLLRSALLLLSSVLPN